MSENRCVCCGAVIPEGAQVCRKCREKWLSDELSSVCVNGESERRADFVMKNDVARNGREKTMQIAEYQSLAARTINRKLSVQQIQLHALHGLCAEVGEIHGLFQKYFQGHSFTADELRKEVGDVAWMLAELCTANGWSLESVLAENIEKLKKRYPAGFSEERSLNRGPEE